MKEFVISQAKAETAVLVGLVTKEQDEAKTKEYLDELEFLADTAGAVTVKRFTQRVGGPSQTTYVGSGTITIQSQESSVLPCVFNVNDVATNVEFISTTNKPWEVLLRHKLI